MNPLSMVKMVFSNYEGWRDVVQIHPSVGKLFVLFVIPMSLIPPAMIYYAGTAYGSAVLSDLTANRLQFIAALFYVAELVAVPIMALVVQQLGEVIGIRPSYQDAFTLAAIAPAPLWLAPLFLFIPSLALNVIVTALALMACALLIYHGVYLVFKLEDEGKSLLMAGSIYAAGLVAWVSLMVLTLLIWGYSAT